MTFTSRRMKRVILSIPSIPLDSADSLYNSSEKSNPMRKRRNLIRMRIKKRMMKDFPMSILLW